MMTASSFLRSLLLLTVTFTALQTPAAAQASVQPDERRPITYEQVYGSQRIVNGRRATQRFRWIDDERFLRRDRDGWQSIDARSGDSEPWYDVDTLAESLAAVDGISAADARRLARGDWTDLDVPARRAVFEHENMLVRMTVDGGESAVVRDLPDQRELLTVSPTGSAAAFVSGNELWVADFDGGIARRLTHDASDTIRNGKADWVYFEEVYDRSWKAFRFSPDGTRIAFQRFDDSQVPTFSVIDHSQVEQEIETERWPQAGYTNPTVRLGVVSVTGGEVTWVDTSAWPADDLLITHFDWLPDSGRLYWYAQNRIQTWLDLVHSDPDSGASQTLLRDSNDAWIEHPGSLTFLADGSFLMTSDRTGWQHVYRVSADGEHITPVTTGDWEVRELLGVTADQSAVLVTGTRDSHIANNLYGAALDGSATIERLTPDPGHHDVTLNPSGSLFVDRRSTIHEPESQVLRDASGNTLRVLEAADTPPVEDWRFGTVDFLDVPMADGSTTRAIAVYPPDFDESVRHPVWLMSYGGPHRPNVRNAWRSRMLEHLLANLGVVVIRFDPRSASGYGAQSAWIAYRQLGVEESRDAEAVCDWLAEQTWADPERIGMSGHSYGGYYTAYVMTHTDCLTAGIAGAPVTDWAHYDTIYTERFMSTPEDNPDGYRLSSVVDAAARLHGRLLILHGLKDDNVHPANSIQLIHRLQQADKDFEIMFYPTARHGIRGRHYNRLMYNFIVESLGIDAVREADAP